MKLLLSQSGVGPVVTLGFGASGEPANLADAPSVTATQAGDMALINRAGQLQQVPVAAFAGGGTGATDLLASFQSMQPSEKIAFAQAVVAGLPQDGVAGVTRQTGIPIISGGLVVVPEST